MNSVGNPYAAAMGIGANAGDLLPAFSYAVAGGVPTKKKVEPMPATSVSYLPIVVVLVLIVGVVLIFKK